MLRDSQSALSVCLSFGSSIYPSNFIFTEVFAAFGLTAPDQVTSDIAPAYTHVTGVAMHLALFLLNEAIKTSNDILI